MRPRIILHRVGWFCKGPVASWLIMAGTMVLRELLLNIRTAQHGLLGVSRR